MGYIENIKAQAQQTAKAAAYDDMQRQQEAAMIQEQGRAEGLAQGAIDAQEVAKIGIRGLMENGIDPTTKYPIELVDQVVREDNLYVQEAMGMPVTRHDRVQAQFGQANVPEGLAGSIR
jgi:hypothetical protein